MKTKKILAGALAAAVVATSLPGMGVPVFAAGSFLTPNSNCYTTDNPFAFPMGAGEVKTLEAELATTLYNDTSNNENNRWPMKIQTENGVTAVYDMAKNGDYATYAYTAEAGLYLVTAHYACGGNNTMVVSDAVTKSDKVNTVFVQVASTSVNNIPQWRTTQFLLRINKTGAGTLKIASTSGNQAEDAPRLDKLEITKMQMPKYEGENRFSFPTELNAATPATLEAEYGIITNVITTEDENGNYPAQEKMDNDRGKDPWTGNRYFLTSVNTGDSVAYAYHAEKPGIYEFTARYRSGSNDNHYTWSSTDSKIVAGSVQAGHTDSSATQTKTFKVAVAEAGDGILTFAAPNPSSSGKKNMAMTDKFDITLVVDKSDLVSAIEEANALVPKLDNYEDGETKTAFTAALDDANGVNINYTDTLTQDDVNDAVTELNNAKAALVLKTTRIQIKTHPTKKVYNLKEAVNTEGLVVEAVKADGTTEELVSDAYTVTGFDSTSTGTKTLTVALNANTTLTTTTQVEVVDGARLDAKVTEAETKKANKHYTLATKNAFDAKLSAAKTVQDDIKAANGDNNVTASGTAVTAARVEEATTALNSAMNDLEEMYKVTVPAGAELTVETGVESESGSDNANKWVYVPVATKVTVTAPKTNSENKKFAAWTWDKQKLSESNEYAFYVVGDMELQMTYDANTVNEKAVVLVGSTKYTTGRRSFIAKRSVSKKCKKVLEYGVVVTDQKGWDTYYKERVANFVKGSTRTKCSKKVAATGNLLAYNGTFVANLRVTDKNEKWYGRAYVRYLDENNQEQTYYAPDVIRY